MTRLRLTTKTRLDLFLKTRGQCQTCQSKISPGQFWDVDHVIPLALGGPDAVSNLQILCRTCHKQKTANYDVPRIAKSKRQRARHIGARRSQSTIPGSRRSPWKRKMDGTVVSRENTNNDQYSSRRVKKPS